MNSLLTLRKRDSENNEVLGFIKTKSPEGSVDFERIGRVIVKALEESPGAKFILNEATTEDMMDYDRQVKERLESQAERS